MLIRHGFLLKILLKILLIILLNKIFERRERKTSEHLSETLRTMVVFTLEPK